MKYFKHHCNASDREFISILMDRFGHEGYVLWFQFLEVLGAEIDKQIDDFRRQKASQIRPVMSVGVPWLSKRAKSRPERVLEFAFFCRKTGRFSVAKHNRKTGVLTVEIPNFLSNIDEYTRKMVNEVCKERGIHPDSVLTHSGVSPDNILPTPLPLLPSPHSATADTQAAGLEPTPAPAQPSKATPERDGSVADHLAKVYQQTHRGMISHQKAYDQVAAALAVGVKAGDIESEFMSPATRGKKIWEILDPMRSTLKDIQLRERRDAHGPRKL